MKDVSITRRRRISYVMGTQPVSPAINLSKSEMTGGLALLTVKQKKKKKGTPASGFHALRTPGGACVPVDWLLLNGALPDFPQDARRKFISASVCKTKTEIEHLI